jgi:hypothetical protein
MIIRQKKLEKLTEKQEWIYVEYDEWETDNTGWECSDVSLITYL